MGPGALGARWDLMGRRWSFAQPVLIAAGAVAVLISAGGPWLARLAVSVFLCGYAIRWASVDRAWLPLRRRLDVSEATGLRVAMMLYAVAGLPAVAAAVLYLPTAGAAILCGLLLAWSAGWMWALRRIWYASPADQTGSRGHKPG